MATDVVLHFGQPSIKFSFEFMLCFGLDPEPHPRTVVIIEVFLKYKRWILSRNGIDFYETNSDSYASFECRPEFSYSDLRDQVVLWMPGLSPSLCAQLSRGIFAYAQPVAFASRQDVIDDNGGANIVTAFVEIEEPQLLHPITHDQLLQVYTGRLRADIVDDDDDDDEEEDDGIVLSDDEDYDDDDDDDEWKLVRGLSWDEIKGLKQESWFKSGADEEEEESLLICSVCLEEFSSGVKITPLPCSHTFHHNCIATWLYKQASCPLCRFDIRQLCSSSPSHL